MVSSTAASGCRRLGADTGRGNCPLRGNRPRELPHRWHAAQACADIAQVKLRQAKHPHSSRAIERTPSRHHSQYPHNAHRLSPSPLAGEGRGEGAPRRGGSASPSPPLRAPALWPACHKALRRAKQCFAFSAYAPGEKQGGASPEVCEAAAAGMGGGNASHPPFARNPSASLSTDFRRAFRATSFPRATPTGSGLRLQEGISPPART